MVTGLDKFREAFIEYADNYVIRDCPEMLCIS